MKDQVINLLADSSKQGSEQFNKALELYRTSKDHDLGKVRYYNALGFSQDRLEGLLYELKKLHNISDLQVANAKRKRIVLQPEKKEIENKKEYTLEDIDALEFRVVGFNLESSTDEEKAALAQELKQFAIAMSKEEIHFLSASDVQIIEACKEEIRKSREAGALQLKVNDPQEVKSDDSSEATSNTSEETANESKESPEKPEEDSTEATSEAPQATSEETPSQEKKEDQPVDEFKQKLADFDLTAEKYNSIKSFAAEVSNVTGEDPADQKAATLKTFIEEAKKKFPLS